MAVLNDTKLREYLDSKKIIITPYPDDVQIQPASIDLRLDNTVVTFNQSYAIDTRTKKDAKTIHKRKFTDEFPLILEPYQFMLCQTLEKVKVPNDLLARVEGRSSIGRLGVAIHVTAGFIDPGFEGNITLEMVNLGNVPVILYPNQRVCQIVFEELCASCERPYGSSSMNKYQGQAEPTPTAIYRDLENK